jgi:hypothetical protein
MEAPHRTFAWYSKGAPENALDEGMDDGVGEERDGRGAWLIGGP